MLYTLQIVCGFFFVPHSILSTLTDCQTGPMLWHPYLRRLEVQPFADAITKASLSPQLFEIRECWSTWGFEPATCDTGQSLLSL